MSREREMDQALRSDEPGSRRFRDLIARERSDMAWLVHVVASMYDEISGGRVSIPMTYPHEVITAFDERMEEGADEAVGEERLRATEAVQSLAEKLGRRYQSAGQDWPTAPKYVPVDAVIAIINDKEVTSADS
jgi:hypothetical protein